MFLISIRRREVLASFARTLCGFDTHGSLVLSVNSHYVWTVDLVILAILSQNNSRTPILTGGAFPHYLHGSAFRPDSQFDSKGAVGAVINGNHHIFGVFIVKITMVIHSRDYTSRGSIEEGLVG